MILSVITYSIFILLILVGAKFAGFTGFNEDFMSLNKTKALRGLAAIGVLLHHISQQGAFQQTKTLSLFTNNGHFFVAVFFFCSGYGLIKSLISKPDYFNGFIKNRILKTLIIPLFVSTIIYAVFLKFVVHFEYPLAQWILGILGLVMINDYGWFPIVLVILYFAFLFAYRKNKSFLAGNLIVLSVIVLLGVIFCINGHLAWWAGAPNWYLTESGWANSSWWMSVKVLWFSGEWWVNTCIAFLMGILFGQNEEKIISWLKKGYWIKFIVAAFLLAGSVILSKYAQAHIGYWTEWSGKGPGIKEKALTLILQQPSIIMFIVVTFMFMMKLTSENPVTRFFGNISLETYLMNYMAVLLFMPLVFNIETETPIIVKGNLNLIKYEILVLAASVCFGLIYKFICKYLKKLIK